MSTGETRDPITTEVIAKYFMGTAEEMAATLIRTSYSPNVKERADCSTAIVDRTGQVIALAHRIPLHLGSMLGTVDKLRQRIGEARMRPGDMFIGNDPYSGGGTHLPDLTLVAPVFVDAEVAAYVVNIAHHADVGGMVPGSESAACQTIFQEGLRLPLVQIMREGEPVQDIVDIILLNSRTPGERLGDLRAQFASAFVGIRGLESVYAKYGKRVVDGAMEDYLAFTEARFRRALLALPAGRYHHREELDPEEPGAPPIPLSLSVTANEEGLLFDFAGCGAQLPSARNVPVAAVRAVVYAVLKTLLDPGVAANSGYFRAVTVSAPEGTVVNPLPGAAVGSRSLTCAVLGDLVAGALGQANPRLALAGCAPHQQLILSGSHPQSGQVFVDYETVAGAYGAQATRDGMDAVRIHASGASNLPVEALEIAYPLRVERYALRDGSGGAGKQRGGLGVQRDYRSLAPGMTVSLSSEGRHKPPRGLAGGEPGQSATVVFSWGDGTEEQLPPVVTDHPWPEGAIVSIRTAGGGGYGQPPERSTDAILRDVQSGLISAEDARRTYHLTEVEPSAAERTAKPGK